MGKIQEAITLLKSRIADNEVKAMSIRGYSYRTILSALEYAELVEKENKGLRVKIEEKTLENAADDVPMNPIINELNEARCPICNSHVWEYYVHKGESFYVHKDENFCNKCGQRLDWSE